VHNVVCNKSRMGDSRRTGLFAADLEPHEVRPSIYRVRGLRAEPDRRVGHACLSEECANSSRRGMVQDTFDEEAR
jgi:hypothetical protein